MKRFAFIMIFVLFVMANKVMAQETILEEISEMNDVEVTYITRNMLQTMGTNNINIGGFNLSKIAKSLNSLQILNVEDGAVEKVRVKLKTLRKTSGMELIMRLKEDGEITDLYGEPSTDGSYKKILMIVEESDEIILIYLKGNIGSECFEELSKKAQKGMPTIKYKSSQISDSKGNSIDIPEGELTWGIVNIQDMLGNLDSGLDTVENEISSIQKEIDDINKKIEKASWQERENLYKQRGWAYKRLKTLYEVRKRLYQQRNNVYEMQNNYKKVITVGAAEEIKIDWIQIDEVQEYVNNILNEKAKDKEVKFYYFAEK